jgi:hypothetical protein
MQQIGEIAPQAFRSLVSSEGSYLAASPRH